MGLGPIPDLQIVLASIAAWATGEPDLAAFIKAGLKPQDALPRWGSRLLRAQRWDDAVVAFHAALAFDAESFVVWTNLGVALDRAGAFDDAEQCLEKSTQLFRAQPDAWLLLGLVRKKRGKLTDCEAAYRTAIELDPTLPVVWQCLGLLKEEQRDYAAAIAAFMECAKRAPPDAAISANIGKLCYQAGRFTEAFEAYSSAASAEPQNALYAQILRKARFLRDVIQGASLDDAVAIYARSALSDSSAPNATGNSDREKETAQFLEAACSQLSSFGYVDAAVRVIEKRLAIAAPSATAEYLLQALRGDPGINRSPPAYIVESFDAFAESFDAKLVGLLGYDVPEKLCALLRDTLPRPEGLTILDAGCGTGLCGPWLRPMARELSGLDLSPKMLEQAARRGVYDALVCDDLVTFLAQPARPFDLIVAADVLIYFGDLAAVAAGARHALSPSGWLAFSHEYLEGDGYAIQPSGRFAHAPNYVRAAFANGFVEERCLETTIRLEAGTRVRGNLFLFRRC